MMITGLISLPLHADIYEWTDEHGVQHFTNFAPPSGATILIKTPELPYDEAADRARIEADRQRLLDLARLEIAEKEAEIERRAAEADLKVAEAERYSEEVQRQADKFLEEAKNDRRYNRSYGYFGYYRRPHYFHNPNKRHFSAGHFYGYPEKNLQYNYKQRKHFSRKAYEKKHRFKYHGKKSYGASRIGSRKTGHDRRGYSRGSRIGIRRH